MKNEKTKSKNSGRNYSTQFSMPADVYEKFKSIDLSDREKNLALKFLYKLTKNSVRSCGVPYGLVPMPCNYIIKITNKRYVQWLRKLVEHDVVETSGSYSTTKKLCKQYSMVMDTELFDLQTKLEERIVTVSYVDKQEKRDKKVKEVSKTVATDLKDLKYNKKYMVRILKKVLEDITIEKFKVDEEIVDKSLEVTFRENGILKKVWLKRSSALSKAKEMGMSLIKDEKMSYIMTKKDFINMKKISIEFYYIDTISRFDRGIYTARRNSTNNRMDTNITNMPSKLTEELFRQNGLKQIDLKNSQFAILSHTLDSELDTEDFKVFKEQSEEGTLYEYVEEALELESRSEAKKAMFELMFASHHLRSPLKTKLKEVFPSVVNYVDNYKKENGSNQFSISLQKKEAEIFIDNLWTKVKEKDKLCLTVHDSIVVREEDLELALGIMEEYFKEINFKGKITIE